LVCQDCHKRQVLDDWVAGTRAAAQLAPTLASLLAYARAELDRCAAMPPAEDEDLPF
jgi:hypothetical protein